MIKDMLEINVQRIHRLNNSESSLKAFVDITINNVLLIKSIRVVDGKKGLFVSMPQEKSSKDKKWYDSVKCLNTEVKELINQQVLEAYLSDTKS